MPWFPLWDSWWGEKNFLKFGKLLKSFIFSLSTETAFVAQCVCYAYSFPQQEEKVVYFLKSEEPLEDAINLFCQAGRAMWQSETRIDAKMWSVTFLTVTPNKMDGFWNTSQEAETLMWSSVGLSAQIWLAVSEVVGFCQPSRHCIVSLQTPLLWRHLQDPALVLAPWAIVS